ncbi:hypothetical protein HKX48_009377, partial [Thoreauomyces humboldtii]
MSSDFATNFLIGGLLIQVASFSVFVLLAAPFHRRAHANQWKWPMLALYVSSLYILARSMYRAIEFSQGNIEPIATRESFMYAFDFVFMQFASRTLDLLRRCTME